MGTSGNGRKNDGEAVHLAGKWAAKESVVKAWCAALGSGPAPYTLDNTPWAGIEVLDEANGCPRIVLDGEAERRLRASVGTPDGADLCWFVSISHDGPIASAVVVLCAQ